MVEARATRKVAAREVRIRADEALLDGTLGVAADARGVVIFSHGSGSGRNSPRNRQVARSLCEMGFATLLFDLLTAAEDASGSGLRFDIDLLTGRLSAAVRFAREDPLTKDLPVGLFGASTGAAAALRVAASMAQAIGAVVSRGGRPDLVHANELQRVTAPILLIVGGADHYVLERNEAALSQLRCEKALAVVSGATHLFEEPGKLEAVSNLAAEWFTRYLHPPGGAAR